MAEYKLTTKSQEALAAAVQSAAGAGHPHVEPLHLLLALLAGIATGAAVWLAGGRGPGAAIGLLTGGILAAFVAERVGFLARRPDTIDSLHGIGLSTAPPVLDLVDFKIRLAAVLLAWPVAALVAHASVLAILPGRDD